MKCWKKLDGIPSAFVSNADESGSQDWVNKIGGITYVPKGYENEKYPMKRTGARSTLMACVNLDGTTHNHNNCSNKCCYYFV